MRLTVFAGPALARACVVTSVVGVLAGCSTDQVGSPGGGGDCTSHYELVGEAPTRKALERDLLALDGYERARTLNIFPTEDPDDDKLVVNLLNGRDRTVLSLEMWRRDDGSWTAQQWSQCIDS